jgi:hypothetical protein
MANMEQRANTTTVSSMPINNILSNICVSITQKVFSFQGGDFLHLLRTIGHMANTAMREKLYINKPSFVERSGYDVQTSGIADL